MQLVLVLLNFSYANKTQPIHTVLRGKANEFHEYVTNA
jgi:hypothetical protein